MINSCKKNGGVQNHIYNDVKVEVILNNTVSPVIMDTGTKVSTCNQKILILTNLH